jgi:ribosomal protein S18 acetylase RimI-like enzyme
VRLTALKDAPYAFGSTWEREKDRHEKDWRHAVASRVRLVAEQNQEVVGMAAVGPSTVARAADVTSFWVDPQVRGMGVGDSLMLAVIAWAKERGFNPLRLWVTEGNAHAEKLYGRHGFRRTGHTKEVRPDDTLLEFEMSLTLS